MIDKPAKRPYAPLVSIYPNEMSVGRARHEARQVWRSRSDLPRGHPYRWLPLWVPYKIARFLMRSE